MDEISPVFSLSRHGRYLILPALAAGFLSYTVISSNTSGLGGPQDQPVDALAFDDSDLDRALDPPADGLAESAGQAVPPDAVGDGVVQSADGSLANSGPVAPPGAISLQPVSEFDSYDNGGGSPVAQRPFKPATPPKTSGSTTATTTPASSTAPTAATAPTTTPTTSRPTTSPTTAAAPTTAAPTTAGPTTAAPTTAAPTTAAPTTAAPTTAAPTTSTPTTAQSNARIIGVMLEGESTSDPNDGWNRYPASVTEQLGSSVSVKVDGTNGYRIDNINDEGSKAGLLTSGDGANVAVLWIGINDTSQGKEPTRTYSEISEWVQNRRSEGWDRVVLLTVTKFEHGESVKSYSWGSHDIADQKRRELNELIVANAAGADTIVDLRNIVGIGDGYSVHDTTYRADRVHFTNTGNELVADAVVAALR